MITKRPWEEMFRTMQFSRPDGGGPLNDDETVTAATVTIAEIRTGTDRTASMISDVAPYSGTQVRYRLKGGDGWKEYQITIRAETSNGQKFEEVRTLKVQG